MRIPMQRLSVLALAFVLAPIGCNLDDDDADLAGLIGTQLVPLTVDTADLVGTDLVTISTVSAPAFLTAVKREFGRGPDSVELSTLNMRVNSPSVADWSYLWSGEVTVSFVPASSDTSIVVARGTPPTSFGDFAPRVSVTKAVLDQFPDIAEGNFAIHVSGPTNRQAGDTFQQQVVIEMEFLVY